MRDFGVISLVHHLDPTSRTGQGGTVAPFLRQAYPTPPAFQVGVVPVLVSLPASLAFHRVEPNRIFWIILPVATVPVAWLPRIFRVFLNLGLGAVRRDNPAWTSPGLVLVPPVTPQHRRNDYGAAGNRPAPNLRAVEMVVGTYQTQFDCIAPVITLPKLILSGF